MSTKKSAVKKPTPQPPEREKQPPQELNPAEPQPEAPQPQPEKPKPLTQASLKQEIQSLRAVVDDHANLMAQLQEIIIRKRKPVASSGKVQIKDKQTGVIYRSKNNAYQNLLKSGELKELVDKGVFGDVPEKNSFGWYTLVRYWPDRFEEIKAEEPQP